MLILLRLLPFPLSEQCFLFMTSQNSLLLNISFQKSLGNSKVPLYHIQLLLRERSDSVNTPCECDKGRIHHLHMLSIPTLHSDNSDITTEYLTFSLIPFSNLQHNDHGHYLPPQHLDTIQVYLPLTFQMFSFYTPWESLYSEGEYLVIQKVMPTILRPFQSKRSLIFYLGWGK